MMRPPFPLALIQSLEPSEQNLLNILCGQLSDDTIMRIARADYGYGAEANFADLKQFVHERVFPSQMTFGIHEVLQLTRWLQAETKEEVLARSYACVLLLNLKPETQYDESAESSSLIALVDGAIRLPELSRPALQFAAWKVLKRYEQELAYCRDDGDDESEAYIESYSLFALLLLMIVNDAATENVQTIYNELTGYRQTDEEKTAAVENLLQESGVQQTLWRELTRQLLNL